MTQLSTKSSWRSLALIVILFASDVSAEDNFVTARSAGADVEFAANMAPLRDLYSQICNARRALPCDKLENYSVRIVVNGRNVEYCFFHRTTDNVTAKPSQRYVETFLCGYPTGRLECVTGSHRDIERRDMPANPQ